MSHKNYLETAFDVKIIFSGMSKLNWLLVGYIRAKLSFVHQQFHGWKVNLLKP